MDFLVVGAGKIGAACAITLRDSPNTGRIIVVDKRKDRLEDVAKSVTCDPVTLDAAEPESLSEFFNQVDCAFGVTTPEHYRALNEAAINAGTHWIDLGGDDSILEKQLELDERAKEAGVTAVPSCGLAPGIVNMLAVHGAAQLDAVDEISLYVGGLPQEPQPPLEYSILFSVEGLLAEYVEPVEIIDQGIRTTVRALDGYETLALDEIGTVEAFYTAGALSTLPERFEGHVDRLTYKTLRYPGHRDKIMLLRDLGLLADEPILIDGTAVTPREVLASVLTEVLQSEVPDFVVARIEVAGSVNGSARQFRTDIYDEYDATSGFSAMMRSSAFPVTVVGQMAADGKLDPGVYPPEGGVPLMPVLDHLRGAGIRISESIE